MTHDGACSRSRPTLRSRGRPYICYRMPQLGCYRSRLSLLSKIRLSARTQCSLPPEAAEVPIRSKSPSSINCSSDICDFAIDIVDQTLCALASPDSDSSVQCAQVSQMISGGIAGLELYEQFQCRLIRLCFQACDHFRPVLGERVSELAASLSVSRRCFRCSITTPRARAFWRQRFILRFRELYCRAVNFPGNWRHSSSNNCVELMFGSSSWRRQAIGHTLRKGR